MTKLDAERRDQYLAWIFSHAIASISNGLGCRIVALSIKLYSYDMTFMKQWQAFLQIK
jgi:hypothetical protein